MYSDGVHLISSLGVKDLHRQAYRLGIKRCWFHMGGGGRFPHYDIPKLRRATFFQDHPEVVRVDAREIVRILKQTVRAKKAFKETREN